MSDPASVQFKGPHGDVSCIAYAHWGKPILPLLANEYAAALTAKSKKASDDGDTYYPHTPLGRFAPDAVLADFLDTIARGNTRKVVDRILPPDYTGWAGNDHLIIELPYFPESPEGSEAKA